MDSLSVRAGVGLALDLLGTNALRQSDNLNRFVDFVTGGEVNRDVLAKRVWHTVGQLAREFAASPEILGEVRCTLAPLALTALLLGDKKEMIDAVGKLVKKSIDIQLTVENQGSIRTDAVSLVGDAAALISSKLASYADEKSAEKMLATMVGRHGWEPLEKLLENSLSGSISASFLFRQLKNIVDMTIVKDTSVNRGLDEKGFYSTVADMADHAIRGREISTVLQPLRAFLPAPYSAIEAALSTYHTAATAVAEIKESVREHIAEASAVIVNTTHYVAETVPSILENLQLATGIGLESVVISDAFAQEASRLQGTAPSIPIDAKDSEIAERYLTELVVASARRTGQAESVPKAVAAPGPARVPVGADIGAIAGARVSETGDVNSTATANVISALSDMMEAAPTRGSEALQVVQALSEAQLAPLGDRSGIAVVKTLTGKMTEIDAVSHRLLEKNARYADDVVKGLTVTPIAVEDLGGYRVDSAFAADFESLTLVMPDASYGMSDTAVEGARTMFNTVWGGMWGSETAGLSHAANTQLKQLWNVCGGNEQVMQEATQYMSVGVARKALADPMKVHFLRTGFDTARVDVGNGVSVDLKDIDAPEYRFDIRNHDGLVNVSIEAHWPISAFGSREAGMRTPQGDQNSALISTVSITIRAMPDDSLVVNHYAMGTTATIENKIAFDSATGRLADPLAL